MTPAPATPAPMTPAPASATTLAGFLAAVTQTLVTTTFAGTLLASALGVSAFAADAPSTSAWDGDRRSSVRLLAGERTGGEQRAGVEVQLAAGWKTYWRYPGDAGVSPIFDFSGSENVRSVSVLWPAPHRFRDEGGASIGYKVDVIFPVHVVLEDPGRPATLRLTLDYAACERLCVPAHGQAELELTSAPPPNESRLGAAEALVPKPAQLGGNQAAGNEVGGKGGEAPLGIVAVRLEPGQPHPRVVVDVVAPPDAPLDLFAEGPTAEWALPLPEPVAGAPPGRRRFAFDLEGEPPGVDGMGAPLRFTLVSGENAIEVTAVPK